MENGKEMTNGAAIENGQDGTTSRMIAKARPEKCLVLMAGLLYLGLILLGIFAQVTKMGLVVNSDPSATVQNIISSGGALEMVFISGMASHVCYLLLGIACYGMFREIDRRVASLMLIFVLVSGVISIVNALNILDAMQIINGQTVVSPADADLVLQHLTSHTNGEYIAQVFGWGPWLVPLGYLVYRSGYAPKALGIILMVGGVGLTFQAIQYFLLPGLSDLSTPGVMMSMLAEFTFCPWLIYRGIKGNAPADDALKNEPGSPEVAS
jgi:hypothetical protein